MHGILGRYSTFLQLKKGSALIRGMLFSSL